MKNFRLLILIALFSCQEIKKKDITGLWQLEEVTVDIMPKKFAPTFIQIYSDNTFAVAKPSGDLSGLYDLRSDRLELHSEDAFWFNNNWELSHIDGNLIFSGSEFGHRRTKLRFRRVDEIPDFQAFENAVTGKWQLYKIMSEGPSQPVSDTWFEINAGNYHIYDASGILESGRAIVNTRHRKIIFENDSTIWNAWFYGRELRLKNEQLAMQYCLRRPK